MINKDKPQICIVCFANFCRSPVAEIILNNLYGNEYNFFSAGIQPLPKADMDLRSQSFLSSREYNFSIHNPKKINNNLFSEADFVYAIDFEILSILNKMYPRKKKIIRQFKVQFKNKIKTDHFKLNEK